MIDSILIIKDKMSVVFQKRQWTPQDIELANCFNFEIKDGNVCADIRRTSNTSLFEFMKTAYPSFVFHSYYEEERKNVFQDLSECYKKIRTSFDEFAKDRWDKFDELYDYQKESAMYGVLRKYNIFGLEQGLGKTLTSIAVNEILGFEKCLIVAPAACKWNWFEELLDWDIFIHEISMIDSKQPFNGFNGKYLIINYDMLSKYKEKLSRLNIGHIILDEAHKVKNLDSIRTKTIQELIKDKNCKVSFLSGTPTPNDIKDIFIYLHLSEHPFGVNMYRFVNRFFWKPKTKENPTHKPIPRDLDYLNKSIQNLLIRKTKEQCLKLPEKRYHKLVYSLGEYRSEYEYYYNELKEKLMQTGKAFDIESYIQRLNIITAKAKIKHIIQLAEGLIGEKVKVTKGKVVEADGFSVGESFYTEVFSKVIIYCVNTEPLNILQNHFGKRCLRIDGSVESKKRIEIVNKFKSDNEINALICNLDAAGIGLNIVNREHQTDRPPICKVIHVNLPFTPAQLEQGNDRVHRIGQYMPVDVYYTIAEDTIDEDIMRIIERKFSNVTHLIEGRSQNIDFNNIDSSIIDDLKDNIISFQEVTTRQELLNLITDGKNNDTEEGILSQETCGFQHTDSGSSASWSGGSSGVVRCEEQDGIEDESKQVQCEEDNL